MKFIVKTLVLLLFLLVTTISCRKGNPAGEDSRKTGIRNSYLQSVLRDDFDNELVLDTISKSRDTQFSPVYIGKIKAVMRLNYHTPSIGNRVPDHLSGKYRSPVAEDLNIFIDTTRTIGFPMYLRDFYDSAAYRTNKMSYPILITNQSTDTLELGFGDILQMVTEAKDSAGEWKQIEPRFSYGCGMGRTTFFLPPGEIIISALRQNFGNTPTHFRVKYLLKKGEIYSNEISGNIDSEFFIDLPPYGQGLHWY